LTAPSGVVARVATPSCARIARHQLFTPDPITRMVDLITGQPVAAGVADLDQVAPERD
jgi:hypothetical protein